MPFLAAIVTGAASAFAFQPFALWPLMLVAFALLCALIRRAPSMRSALAIGWGFGFGQFAVGLNWIATAFTFQAAMPAWLGWVAVALLSLYLAVYPMLGAGLAWRFGRERPVALVLVLAGGWAIAEWLRAGMFTGFAWNPVGATLADTPLLHTSALVGTYGLSALVAIGGGMLWLAVQRQLRAVAGFAGALLLAAAFPAAQIPDGSTRLRPVRIVQPNIGQEIKWSDEGAHAAQTRLARLSDAPPGEPAPRLLLWPEAAITEPLDDARVDPRARAVVASERLRAASRLRFPNERLLTGGLALHSADGRRIDGAANSVFVIAPGGRLIGRYDKAHLVPYGEYLPMRPLLSAIGLSRLAPGDLDFAAGPGPRTIDLGRGWGKVGIQLCYEIIFSGEVIDRRNRPGFLFNPSNDAWFGRWGPPQHLAQARLRAAEEGMPIVRSTPTGISALIDARGRIVKQLPWRQAGVIDAALPAAARSLTPFARFGNAIALLFAAGLLIGGIALGLTRR